MFVDSNGEYSRTIAKASEIWIRPGVTGGRKGLFSLISMIIIDQNMKPNDGCLKMVFFDGGSGCYRNYVAFLIIPTIWIVKTLPLGTILAYPSRS